MTGELFAAYEMLGHPDKLLAVVGGAAVGGLGVGFLVQLVVRGWTRQEVPRWAMMTLRVVAGVASGWLVALWLFSGGGGGLGGPGGPNIGGNDGNNNPQAGKDKDERKDDLPNKVNTLYVEVLGTETLKQIDPNHFDPQHCYRIGTQLLTQEQVIEHIKQRQKEGPPLEAVTLVLYDNGPSEQVPKVADLKDEVGALTVPGGSKRLSVAVLRRTQNAPVK
jgi:hypothetical protein